MCVKSLFGLLLEVRIFMGTAEIRITYCRVIRITLPLPIPAGPPRDVENETETFNVPVLDYKERQWCRAPSLIALPLYRKHLPPLRSVSKILENDFSS